MSFLVWQSSAWSRDSDGTRMQARKIDFGVTHDGRISPPNDIVDWRYVQVQEPVRFSMLVTSKPESVALTMRFTSATGEELASARSTNGRLAFSQALQPGIYYFSLSADEPLGYQVSIRATQ